MSVIGVFSDSDGDLEALDRALTFLSKKGAKRFLFAGGNYKDLDDWVEKKREEAKAQTDYSNLDFLADVSSFLDEGEQVDRPPAFGTAYELSRRATELAQLKGKVLRTPEKGSLAYQDPAVPKKAVDMMGEVLVCVVHDKNDLDKEDMLNAVCLVHGKEAEPKLVQIGPRYFVTPGRVSGSKPTVGMLELTAAGLKFTAYDLEDKVIVPPTAIQVAAKKKISVK